MKKDISKWWDTGEEFYAFHAMQPGCVQLNLHWAPSPDRYNVSHAAKPALTWSHRFSFYAYCAEKYYVLRAISAGIERYRVTTDEPDDLWGYVFSFYGFLNTVPGTVKYYIQEKWDDTFQCQVCKISSAKPHSGWSQTGVMCVFDLPAPGTTKFSLYLGTKPSRYRIEPEHVHCNSREWQHVSDMYAFAGGDGPLSPRYEDALNNVL